MPIEIFLLIIGIIFSVIGYLFIQQGRHRDRLLVMETTQTSIAEDFENLSKKITEGFRDVKDDIKDVNTRLDLFMKNEIDLLRGIVNKQSNGS